MTYKIRERVRHNASPKDGLEQEWAEYQVVSGNTIIARCDTRDEAEARREELLGRQRPLSGFTDMDREAELRASIIHGLRMKGWSRIEAENAADERIEKWRQRRAVRD